MIKTPLHILNNSSNKVLAFIAIMVLPLLSTAGVNQYTFSQTTGTYTPLENPIAIETATSTTTVAQSIHLVTDSLIFPGGFVFNFNGSDQTKCYLTSNGYIYFGAASALVTVPLSNSNTAMTGVISAWGRESNGVFNIAGITSSINYQLTGNAPNRVLTIEYKNMRPNFTGSATSVYTLSYQILMHETSNIIEIIYDQGGYKAGATAISSSMQAGLRGATNADFNVRTNATTAAFTSSTAATTAGAVQNYTTAAATPGMPASGLTYRFTPPAPLPIDLENFTGINKGTTNILSWSTANETNFDHFELEKSADGSAFQTIATIALNATANGRYNFIDKDIYNGQNFYRLKMTDKNGAFSYSKIVVVNAIVNNPAVSVYPNPANDYVIVQSNSTAPAIITLSSASGNIIRSIHTSNASSNLDLSTLSAGTYIIRYQSDASSQTFKIVKQ